MAELTRWPATPSKPSFIRDDLMVKVQAVDRTPLPEVIAQLDERAGMAAVKIGIFERILRRLRGELSEEEFLRTGDRVGPYLTCLRGLSFEREHRDWCVRAASVVRSREVTCTSAM